MKRISLLVTSAFLFNGFEASAAQKPEIPDWYGRNITPYLAPKSQVDAVVGTAQTVMNIIDDHKIKNEQRKILKKIRKNQ